MAHYRPPTMTLRHAMKPALLAETAAQCHAGRCAILSRPHKAAHCQRDRAASLVHGEVFMATDIKPLRDLIADASAELKLARRDGSAEWIGKAAAALDELIDKIPRPAQATPQ